MHMHKEKQEAKKVCGWQNKNGVLTKAKVKMMISAAMAISGYCSLEMDEIWDFFSHIDQGQLESGVSFVSSNSTQCRV